MGMRIMLFTGDFLCYVINMITNSYIDYLSIYDYAIDNKWELDQNKRKKKTMKNF